MPLLQFVPWNAGVCDGNAEGDCQNIAQDGRLSTEASNAFKHDSACLCPLHRRANNPPAVQNHYHCNILQGLYAPYISLHTTGPQLPSC